jgi:ketosteroid isomerase-like protein
LLGVFSRFITQHCLEGGGSDDTMRLVKRAILLGLLMMNFVAQGATALEEAKEFFNTYTNLYAKFDPAVTNLYANDAVLKNQRHMADGTKKPLSMTGALLKSMIRNGMMELAKERGDTSTYKEVKFVEEEGKVRITCSRYSEMKKYTSPLVLVIAKRGERWVIVEEHSESKQVAPQ